MLLALGILLAQKASVRRMRLSGPLNDTPRPSRTHFAETAKAPMLPGNTPTIPQDTTAWGASLPEAHRSFLAHSAPVRFDAHASFVQRLDRLKVPRPALPENARANAAHLYEASGKRSAQVGTRWFQVRVEGDEPV
ncbi:hypothetical protein, partial [Pseudomonas fluorescens]|uniref:hypothetical protein n=1 Tax=Pseudomonas fluorescens TaxID=294 RepID=UPI00160A3110